MTVEDAVRTVTPRANATCYKRLLTSVAFQASHARKHDTCTAPGVPEKSACEAETLLHDTRPTAKREGFICTM